MCVKMTSAYMIMWIVWQQNDAKFTDDMDAPL